MNGHFDVVQLLLSHKSIDVNTQNDGGYTALYLAASEGCTDIVKILLGVETIDVNHRGRYHETPLHLGAST